MENKYHFISVTYVRASDDLLPAIKVEMTSTATGDSIFCFAASFVFCLSHPHHLCMAFCVVDPLNCNKIQFPILLRKLIIDMIPSINLTYPVPHLNENAIGF